MMIKTKVLSTDPLGQHGGPAFPQSFQDGFGSTMQYQGMTLRDWFAGQTLSGIMGARAAVGLDNAERAANVAYAVADAMLKARNKPQDDAK